ncbi:MAG: hypothetical protein NW223_10520 [Hyphomicrobiaceae bacterium]|nr:hypothetical protein [Hyphomicrobiaceae bacterium]
MSPRRPIFLTARLEAHEGDDYLAHLRRLDRSAQSRRFAGQLAPAALTERARLAARDAVCVIIARADGHVRAAAELWETGGLVEMLELALSVEARFGDAEARVTAHAIRDARERGILRLVYQAGASGSLPVLPTARVSRWRPWSAPGTWCCDLDKIPARVSSLSTSSRTLPVTSGSTARTRASDRAARA